ncbi:MAG: hypothetical protein JW841_11885 [Deltaproteobacteria bacterium]|nr:hypothetical protein [Deltaproteobacteria bacterium]
MFTLRLTIAIAIVVKNNITRCFIVVLILATLAFSGCATFKVKTNEYSSLVSTRALDPIRVTKPKIEKCMLNKQILQCSVTNITSCTPVFEQTRHRFADIEREVNGNVITDFLNNGVSTKERDLTLGVEWTSGVLGAIAAGAGAIMLAKGGVHCSTIRRSGEPERQRCIDYNTHGKALSGIGAVLLTIPIIDLIRSFDTTKDLGITKSTIKNQASDCSRYPSVNTSLTAKWTNGHTNTGTTDKAGYVAFKMSPDFQPPKKAKEFWATISIENQTNSNAFNYIPTTTELENFIAERKAAKEAAYKAQLEAKQRAWPTETAKLLDNVEIKIPVSLDEATAIWMKIEDAPDTPEAQKVLERIRNLEIYLIKKWVNRAKREYKKKQVTHYVVSLMHIVELSNKSRESARYVKLRQKALKYIRDIVPMLLKLNPQPKGKDLNSYDVALSLLVVVKKIMQETGAKTDEVDKIAQKHVELENAQKEDKQIAIIAKKAGCNERVISGLVVKELEPHLYEFVDARGRHALVYTYKTRFENVGSFKLCVFRKTMWSDVATSVGFIQRWPMYIEDPDNMIH